ncbi:hypothetical protein PATSB16_11300 [Pandoraea thiooxydans]|nr:hypothetical protein PATSB16_11300 [Pandoraea thiooxydans]
MPAWDRAGDCAFDCRGRAAAAAPAATLPQKQNASIFE